MGMEELKGKDGKGGIERERWELGRLKRGKKKRKGKIR